MNVQDSSRFRGTSDVRQVGLTPGYMSGFGNSFETEALAGALPVGRNSPQKVSFGLYAEQLSGSAVHGTAGQQPALVALPHPPHRQALRPLQEDRSGTHSYRPLGAGGKRPPDRSAALGADPDARRDTDLRERPAHHDHGRRRRDTNRHGGTCAARHRLHAERVLLQCGRRAADCRAGAQPSFPHRVRRHRDRAWRDLRDPARHDLQGRTHRWTCARICV